MNAVAADRPATRDGDQDWDRDLLRRTLGARVYDVARESPLEHAPLLSEKLGQRVLLKREDQQPVFSFKLRGAYNKMVGLDAAQRARGVIAASAGNHAQGVALAAAKLGLRATIVMPVTAPQVKIDAVRRLGGAWVEVPPGGLVVVEGVSATRREVPVPWDVTIWVDARRERRLARGPDAQRAGLAPLGRPWPRRPLRGGGYQRAGRRGLARNRA